MESVVATVTGYRGTERFNLIKLISYAGGNYVGAMSRSITHLICWKFQGRKYDIAKKCQTIIVNHRWVEDCLKQKKRVPEHPYMLQSGYEVGPLLLEVPYVPKVKKQKVLSNKTKAWTSSSLLNENAESSSHSSKTREKRKSFDGNQFAKPKSLRREERIAKRNINIDVSEMTPSGYEQDCRPVRAHKPNDDDVTVVSNHLNKARKKEMLEVGRTSDDGNSTLKETRNEVFKVVEADTSNQPSPFMEPNVHTNDALATPKETSKDEYLDIEKSKEQTKGHDKQSLSCVICWDRNEIRAALPCGHRFCYSCIQKWIDHLVSSRMVKTCPLCKASFEKVIIFEDAATTDQKIYSQTIPCGESKMEIVILNDEEMPNFRTQAERYVREPVCISCNYLEPADLLMNCNVCQVQCIHCYCLDPYQETWTCTHCKDLRNLLNRY
ncbi:hypothetical protein UlMin_014465 [Ulmus minor]